jgi:hypothetical protein
MLIVEILQSEMDLYSAQKLEELRSAIVARAKTQKRRRRKLSRKESKTSIVLV